MPEIEEPKTENIENNGPVAQENFISPVKPEKQTEEKKKKPLWRRILDIVIYAFFGVAVAFTVIILISTNTGTGSIFGHMFPQVLTDSMANKYPVGTVLIVKEVGPEEIAVGDAVTFKWTVGDQVMNMTHEIFKVEYDPNVKLGYGQYTFYAHGTNTHSEWCKISETEYGDCTDVTNPNNVQKFNERSVVGKVTGELRGLGFVYDFVKKPIGLVVLILVPCLYLMVTSVIDLFKKLPDDDEETAGATSGSGPGTSVAVKKVTYADGSDPLAGLTDEEKERLKKQMLDELLGKKGGK